MESMLNPSSIHSCVWLQARPLSMLLTMWPSAPPPSPLYIAHLSPCSEPGWRPLLWNPGSTTDNRMLFLSNSKWAQMAIRVFFSFSAKTIRNLFLASSIFKCWLPEGPTLRLRPTLQQYLLASIFRFCANYYHCHWFHWHCTQAYPVLYASKSLHHNVTCNIWHIGHLHTTPHQIVLTFRTLFSHSRFSGVTKFLLRC